MSGDAIDWEKVVSAVVKEVDYDIWKERFLPIECDDYEEDCVEEEDRRQRDLAFLIETAMIAAGELKDYSK